MRYFVFPILFAILCYAFSGCGTKFRKNKDHNKDTYVYDEAKNRCQKSGEKGLNFGVIGECGHVSNEDLSNQDFSDQNLKGMVFENVILTGAKFHRSNLFGAVFRNSQLTGTELNDSVAIAVFENADLSSAKFHGTQFVRLGENAIKASFKGTTKFAGAEIDGRTLMRVDLNDAIEKHKMVYVGQDIQRQQVGAIGSHNFAIEYDHSGSSKLKNYEIARVHQDLQAFARYDLKHESGWFERVFGGSKVSMYRYLDDRINYITAGTTRTEKNKHTIAANFGVNYWRVVYNERNLGEQLPLARKSINNRAVVINSPRANIIEIGPEYNNLSLAQVRRLSNHVHEARHSDCPEKPSDADLIAMLRDKKKDNIKSDCNYLHALCPQGHDLQGIAACDNRAWGSYGVAAIYLEKFAKDCTNCSELERQLAIIYEKETKTRILILDEMLAGQRGDPKMQSIK